MRRGGMFKVAFISALLPMLADGHDEHHHRAPSHPSTPSSTATAAPPTPPAEPQTLIFTHLNPGGLL